MNQLFLKTFVMLAWPFIAVGLLISVAMLVAVAWLLIPFGKVVKKGDGKWTLEIGDAQ